jgi:molybdate-binding protein
MRNDFNGIVFIELFNERTYFEISNDKLKTYRIKNVMQQLKFTMVYGK